MKRASEPRNEVDAEGPLKVVAIAIVAGLLSFALGSIVTGFVEGEPALALHSLGAAHVVVMGSSVAGLFLWLVGSATRIVTTRWEFAGRLVALGLVVYFAAALLRGAGIGLGVPDVFPFDFLGAVIVAWAVLRVAPDWTGFDEPASWLPGLAFGAVLFFWIGGVYALEESVTRPFLDPNAVLYAVLAALALGLAPLLAVFGRRHPRRGARLIGLAACIAAIVLAIANRAILVPRLYHYAHIALAFVEWGLWAGAIGWSSSRAGAVWHKVAQGVIAAALALVVVGASGSFAPGSQHIDVGAASWGLVATPVTDLDDDGFAARWAAGSDVDDRDPGRHPFAREVVDEVDQNGNGHLLKREDLPREVESSAPGRADLVVVVTIDMLRPDYLQAYGSDDETSPNLAKLADESIVYDRAYAPGGITTLSLPALIRGRYPLAIEMEPVYRTTDRRYRFPGTLAEGERANRVFRSARPDRGVTVGEVFEAGGGRAIAIIDDGPARVFQKGLGYEKGFDSIWYPNAPEGRGEERWDARAVTDEAVDVVPGLPDGSFVWLHYYDPHAAHPPCRRFEPTPGLGCYRDAIRDVDEQIGRLVDALKQSGRWESVAFFVSSDHGEALGEHGLSHHGLDSYEEFVRIPLIGRWPGIEPGRVARPVSLLDVTASSVLLAGLPLPAEWQGTPLWEAERSIPVLSQTMLTAVDGTIYRQQTLLVEGTTRTMYDRVSGRTWRFDLDSDPEQRVRLGTDGAAETISRWIDVIERRPER